MKRFIVLGLAGGVLSPGVAQAQEVLDRTDPAQVEERTGPPDPAPAAPPTPPITVAAGNAAAPAQVYAVSGIVITGARATPIAAYADIVAQFSARTLDAAALATLTDAIAARARALGYVLATARVEPQTLAAGVLRVTLDEGVVDRITLTGADDPAVRRQLAPLAAGQPVKLAELERRLTLADDIPGVVIRRSRYERQGEEGVLVVEVTRSRASGFVEFENDGSRPLGPERVRADLDLNGLLSAYDELDLTASITPFEPSELGFVRGAYRVLAGTGGTTLGLTGSYSATRPGAYLAERDIFGESWFVAIEARHPLARGRSHGLWAFGELGLRDLRQDRAGIRARHDRVPALRAGLYAIGPVAGGRMRGRMTFSRGLDILGATQLGDPLASRRDASAEFTTLEAWAEWERKLPAEFSVQIAGRGQLATDPLLASEDLGLGGNRFLRGYNYSERTGDEGVMGSGELRYDLDKPAGLLRSLQLYAYADGGVVGNLAGGRGGGALSSAGGGFRADITRSLDLDVEMAVPLTGPRYDTDDQTPRVNLRISHSF